MRTLSTSTGDERVFVHEDGLLIGWILDGEFRPLETATIDETNEMINEALKRKPE